MTSFSKCKQKLIRILKIDNLKDFRLFWREIRRKMSNLVLLVLRCVADLERALDTLRHRAHSCCFKWSKSLCDPQLKETHAINELILGVVFFMFFISCEGCMILEQFFRQLRHNSAKSADATDSKHSRTNYGKTRRRPIFRFLSDFPWKSIFW